LSHSEGKARIKRMDGIIRTIRGDVLKQNLLAPGDMDVKDNILLYLASIIRQQGLTEHVSWINTLNGSELRSAGRTFILCGQRE
jgi:hypothetical protein